MRFHVLVACTALALPASALGDDRTPTDKTTTEKAKPKLKDSEIATLAHIHAVNQMEIDLGKAAQQKGTAPVKRYGEQLVKDHVANDKEIVAFAKKHDVASLPADEPATDADKAEHKQMMEDVAKLKTLRGPEFDRDFLAMMVTGHDKEISKLDTAIQQTDNTAMQDMLRAYKPVLQRHADSARELQKGNAQAVK